MTSKKNSVSEIEHIYNEISDLTGKDFSVFAFSFKMHRLISFAENCGVSGLEELELKLLKSDNLLSAFLNFFYAKQSELFRDAEVWNYLNGHIFPKLFLKKDVVIHIPECVGGEDLYTLLYFAGMYNSSGIKIKVSFPVKDYEAKIKSCIFTSKDLKACSKNIDMLIPAKNPEDIFYERKNGEYGINNFFRGDISFENEDIFSQNYISSFDLVFFRNRMIYYKSDKQAEIIKRISMSIKKNGYLILGEKENTGEASGKFKQKKNNLKIYKKRIF